MSYLMEAREESHRLIEQERSNPSHSRLLAAGLRPGARVVDVGCGSGATIPAMLELIGPSGQITAVEPNDDRLDDARKLTSDDRVAFVKGSLPDTKLPSACADFVWSQFVFEYLPEPAAGLEEMIRIARPGGKVVVSDIDGAGLGLWPVPDVVQAGFPRFLKALAKTGFDIEVGRKLFTMFHRAKLTQIRVHLSHLYLAAGTADRRLFNDWVQRFRVLAPIATPEFGSEENYDLFCRAYLGAVAAPDTLKFAIVLITEGTRP